MKTKVLVTGAGGFLGKHLMAQLSKDSYEFADFSCYYSPKYKIDLRSEPHVIQVLSNFQPDIIYHLAANVGGIDYNIHHPVGTYEDNILMNTHLISQAAKLGVKKFIFISSVCAYPKNVNIPTKEYELWNGYPEESNAPYGVAKRVALTQLLACQKEYGMKFEYPILTNLYGPGDNFEENAHVVAALVRKFLDTPQNWDDIIIWGNGTPTRDFLYVEDAARALTKFLDCEVGQPVNISTNKEVSIKELVEYLKELTDSNRRIVWAISKPNGQPRRCFDNTLAKSLLDWQPKVLLWEGLLKTLEWYAINRDDK